MNRKELIKDLQIIDILLKELVGRTKNQQKQIKKIRELSKLPKTVHNKARLTNYLRNGTNSFIGHPLYVYSILKPKGIVQRMKLIFLFFLLFLLSI